MMCFFVELWQGVQQDAGGCMKKIHIAFAVTDIEVSVNDYAQCHRPFLLNET